MSYGTASVELLALIEQTAAQACEDGVEIDEVVDALRHDYKVAGGA